MNHPAVQPRPSHSVPAAILAFPSSRRATHPDTSRRPIPLHLDQNITIRFGQRLKNLRRLHQKTQYQMAHEFGIDRTFISDMERGRKSVSLPLLEVIALGFKVSLSELLQGV